jgi:hypothetical protein
VLAVSIGQVPLGGHDELVLAGLPFLLTEPILSPGIKGSCLFDKGVICGQRQVIDVDDVSLGILVPSLRVQSFMTILASLNAEV